MTKPSTRDVHLAWVASLDDGDLRLVDGPVDEQPKAGPLWGGQHVYAHPTVDDEELWWVYGA